MNTIVRDITEELIHAYVDSQLSPDEHIRFERHMKSDPVLREKVEAYKLQNALLHDLFDPVLEEPVPSNIDISAPTKHYGGNGLLNLAASFLLLCIGGLGGWFANEQSPAINSFDNASIAHTATIAHRVYVPEVKHPVEVSAENEQHLVKWLSKRLGKSINAPDLNSLGYNLVGGRLLPSENGAAAQFMYENVVGKRLTLFVRNAKSNEKDTAFHFYEEEKDNAFYWIDGNLGYVIVGDVDKNQLLSTANSIYQQLSF